MKNTPKYQKTEQPNTLKAVVEQTNCAQCDDKMESDIAMALRTLSKAIEGAQSEVTFLVYAISGKVTEIRHRLAL